MGFCKLVPQGELSVDEIVRTCIHENHEHHALDARTFVVRDDSLAREVMAQVERIIVNFAEDKVLTHATLPILAWPIEAVAPTFTNLGVLDELFTKGGDAAIFAAAIILQIRRDPTYMSRLIGCKNDRRLRDVVTWRVLRAVRDTIVRYEFTDDLAVGAVGDR